MLLTRRCAITFSLCRDADCCRYVVYAYAVATLPLRHYAATISAPLRVMMRLMRDDADTPIAARAFTRYVTLMLLLNTPQFTQRHAMAFAFMPFSAPPALRGTL